MRAQPSTLLKLKGKIISLEKVNIFSILRLFALSASKIIRIFHDAALYKRGDDTEEKLGARLNEFHNKTKPVLDYYKSKVATIDANDEMGNVTNKIRASLGPSV